ncbi:hypothetical protein [Pseudophaeobacter sp.]|uniref:hypothetical protein n=1 Tax=Pseudophaeobacter sp. TaxID=1971739 RepID=UPI003296DB88
MKVKSYVVVVFCMLLICAFFVAWMKLQEGRDVLIFQQTALEAEIAELNSRLKILRMDDEENGFPKSLVLRVSQQSQGDLQFQKLVVDLAETHGLVVATFGATRLKTPVSRPTLGFEIEGQGSLDDISNFLFDLERIQPPIAPYRMNIRRSNTRVSAENGVPISFQIALWMFWEEER